ncbi:cation:proton antiporter [Paenibacillus rhizophilus]|uniref:Cation:proton antiporter n=1 Tax=Paenibacillus rhizophilus TaxID=1850366 RepID=A0A3N9P1M4_9BACL|nr:cation:proton antiporter [Paenibacillus rhizophilus]RQW10101.1 cation:proton antiporter [Paenibacillus rhizophilus]
MEFILTLLLILLSTKLAGDLAVRLGQPAVLGKLIVGIVLGPAVLGWIQEGEFIHFMSEIGVLLLMFIAGLETDLDQLRRSWKSSIAVAVGGIILPLFGGMGIAELFGFSYSHSLFLGAILSATSVSISAQVLKDMNKLNSREGSTILGAAVVDDILVVIMLAVLMSLFGEGESVSLGLLIGKKLLFFAVALIAGWLIVPRVLKWLAPLKVTEATVSIALVICFAFSWFAEWTGMAGIIGAFAAGIAVSQTAYKHNVQEKLEPIAYAMFVPVFFVSIGLNVSLKGAGSQIGFVIVLSIAAVLSKMIGGGLGARLTGFNNHSSIAIGAGMVSRGEVALIIAAMGLGSGLLPQAYFTSVIIVVIITTLVTPPMLKALFREKVKTGQDG